MYTHIVTSTYIWLDDRFKKINIPELVLVTFSSEEKLSAPNIEVTDTAYKVLGKTFDIDTGDAVASIWSRRAESTGPYLTT